AVKPRPRKRRRTAGGAGEDCWTCKRRAVPCDRKRPYCSQCLEIGRECSGYKTQLSWGVGVASRGKLRGLSCPVIDKNVDSSPVSPMDSVADAGARHHRTASTTRIKFEDDVNPAPTSTSAALHPTTAALSASPSPRLADNLPASFPSQIHPHTPSPEPPASNYMFGNAPFPAFEPVASLPSPTTGVAQLSLPTLDPPYPQHDFFPSSTYMVPTSLSLYDQQQPALPVLDSSAAHQAEVHHFNGNAALLHSNPPTSLALTYTSLAAPTASFDDSEQVEDGQELMLFDPRFANPFFSLPPRLQSLMEFYDRHVCPHLVAVDGHDNPYRTYVLQLALHNQGLQNAVAALACNNLRMRRKEHRLMGFVQDIPDDLTSVNDTTAEEAMHKQMSIEQLNMQLADRRSARDDSVLATLLILCLYHVCDSGFSKFRTQLAGVQKVLAFRDPKTHTAFTRWVHVFFAWFDVMTSTVNDRETEIKGNAPAMLTGVSGLGAMEQFSGCDGRLFMLIAKLGRLNLLAQGRSVKLPGGRQQQQQQHSQQQRPNDSAPQLHPKRKRANPDFSNPRTLTLADYANMDGNGWGTPIVSASDTSDDDSDADTTTGSHDERAEFWSEWRTIRNALESLHLELQTDHLANEPPGPAGVSPAAPSEYADLFHINQAFRHAALLYTERLAHPHRPSAHPSFQTLVQAALQQHISAIPLSSRVNKFLLWPLFIIGTECVDAQQRFIIRCRCVELSRESGFYNNLSALDVLEKVWAEADAEAGAGFGIAGERRARRRDSRGGQQSGRAHGGKLEGAAVWRPYGQAFRWRKAMDRVDGEYIVI
ncbi:fungal-specific transcription factor domain-containing protein, partial [Neohortaea acidophila]